MKRRAILAISASLAAPSIVRAQRPYPNRPVMIVVPLAPGGSVDATIRFIAREATALLGTQVLVENQPGGGQTIAPARVARMPADGHTLLAVTHTPFTTAPHFQPVSFAVKDFTFLAQYATVLYPNYVMKESPFQTWSDVLEFAKSRPETLKWAAGTPLSPQQVANEAAFQMLGLKTISVPFKGGAEALTALLGGHVDMIVTADYGPLLASDKVRLLSEQGPNRAPGMESIPCFGELGYPYTMRTGFGLAGPGNLPEPVVDAWTQVLRRVAENPEWKQLLRTYNFIPEIVWGPQLRERLVEGHAAFGRVLPTLNISP